MSKSIGNVVDPLPVIEEYGSDALRIGIINGRSAAINRGYDQRKVEDGRNFCNKLWNIARYVEDIIGDDVNREGVKPVSAADHWILSKLASAQAKVSGDLDKYAFSEAYDSLYHFIWGDLADWYIEASKVEPNKPLLAYLLESILLMAHPFAPFVTETIWQTLAWKADSILAAQTLSKIIDHDRKAASDFSEIQAIVTETRFILNALKVSGVTLYYTKVPFIANNGATIKQLARLNNVTEVEDGTGLYLTSTKHRCWLDIDKHTALGYVAELDDKLFKTAADISQLESRLSNKNYLKNAPKPVVEQTRGQLQAAQELLTSLDTEKQRFSS